MITNEIELQQTKNFKAPKTFNPEKRFQKKAQPYTSVTERGHYAPNPYENQHSDNNSNGSYTVAYMFNKALDVNAALNSSTSSSGEDDTRNKGGHLVNVFGEQSSVYVYCYNCRHIKKTRVEYDCTFKQWCYCSCLCCTGILCPIFFVPFLSRQLYNVRHYCENCNAYLGESQ